MNDDKDKLDHIINFRATEKMYKDLIEYLRQTGETISAVMRQATYDYLRFKQVMEENGYGKTKHEPEPKKKEEKVNSPPQEIMFCDGDKCEIDPRKLQKC